MQFFRKIIFYIFAAIYVVFCPLMVLYALGFIYKPGVEGGVTETGLIYLSTAPAGATIYMKDSLYTQKTPASIQELLPGEYLIKMTLEGYKPWAQTVPVEAKKATVLDKVLLLPLEWQEKTVLEGKFQDILVVQGTDFFLLKKGPAFKDIFVCNYKEGKAWPLVKPESPFSGAKIVSYFTVDKSSVCLFHVESAQGDRFLRVELEEDVNTVEDLTDLFQQRPQQVEWTPQQETDLFTFQQGHLNRLDATSGAVYPEYIQNVRGYGLLDGEIYVLREGNIFLKMDYDKNNAKTLLDEPALGESIFGQKGVFRVKLLSEDFILFLGTDGELLANRLPYRFVDKGVKGIQCYPQLERVLVWQKDRIAVLDFSTEQTKEVEFEKGPSLTWIYSGGKNIEQCFWVYETSHILFRDGSDLFLAELEEYGKVTLNHIFDVKTSSTIYYSEDTGAVYFLDAASNALLSVGIVPVKGLIQTPFTEKKEEDKTSGTDKP
ncbi:PEGA domain-containing protein [Candidatus Omnitrophota bacterium]